MQATTRRLFGHTSGSLNLSGRDLTGIEGPMLGVGRVFKHGDGNKTTKRQKSAALPGGTTRLSKALWPGR